MNKEPQPQSPEEKRASDVEVISSSLIYYAKSEASKDPTRNGDFQFAADLLENVINNNGKDDFQLVVRAVNSPIRTTDIVGSRGSDLEVKSSARGPVEPGDALPLEVYRKLIKPQPGGYDNAKGNVYVGTYAKYIELGELARALSNNDAEIVYESPIREKIKQQWGDVVAPYIAVDKKPDAENILSDIMDAYSEEGRAHHNLQHIAECMDELEPYKDREDYMQLWFALLMHDETYDAEKLDNEVMSAYGAGIYMEELGLPGADTVQRLILSTKDHSPEAEDEKLICSIDMSILAAVPSRYDKYARDIRREYDFVPSEKYALGRTEFLRSLYRPFTHPDFEALNAAAHANIAREIGALSTDFDLGLS